MRRLFNMDNPLFTFLSKLGDLMLINALCILCCIPIVTMGASITAMFYVTLRMVRNQESYIIKDFFHSFRQNLKQGIVIHLFFMLITIILGLDMYVLWKLLDVEVFFKILFALIIVIAVLAIITYLYVYPLLAQFNNTTRGIIRSALFMSLKHWPYTITFLLITSVPFFAGWVVTYLLEWEILFFLLIGFSTMAYINSHFFVKIFDQYIEVPKDNVSE